MNSGFDTLFYPFDAEVLATPHKGSKTLFINAQHHPALAQFETQNINCIQWFKPYADILTQNGYQVQNITDLEAVNSQYDLALIALPKNRIEAEYLTAITLKALKPDGLILCMAANNAGGGRIPKMLQGFGLDRIDNLSKNKARVAWAYKALIHQNALDVAIDTGKIQPVLSGAFLSQSGIFGWNKIDKGSALLTQYLPRDLQGIGADFGCGYGYLSRHVLQNCTDIKTLYCIDADARAVQACLMNANTDGNARIIGQWADLTQTVSDLPALDFIIMNPPFHAGKETDNTIGAKFIAIAASSLKPDGALWMVANTSLPYETHLKNHFSYVEKIFEENGFKGFFCLL